MRLERDLAGMPDVPAHRAGDGRGHAPRALGSELGTEVDLRRFRTNLHLELDAEPWAELGWAGAEIELEGGVRLRIEGACERCAIPTRDPDTREKWPELLSHLAAAHGQDFGVLARVIAAGRVSAGEQVRIEDTLNSGIPGNGR